MKTFTFLLVLKGALLCWWILNSGAGLFPDEAQYWTWSHVLDWGYYSKPPAIAWQIWLSCKIFGDTVLGIRFGAVVLSILLALAVYRLGNCCGTSRKASFWSGVVMAFCPIGIMGSFVATTDGGFILFWVLTVAEIARSLQRNKNPNYLLIGLFIACGALFKWPIYFLWIPVIFVFPFATVATTAKVCAVSGIEFISTSTAFNSPLLSNCK